MEAGKMADAYGSFSGHELEQADAEQAYIQAPLEGEEAWVELPEAVWKDTEHAHMFFESDGKTKKHKRLRVRCGVICSYSKCS